MSNEALALLLIPIQFFSGSVMYSQLFAKMLSIDLRKIRDGNPGSSNLWRAAGWQWGLSAMLLDYFKGVFPLSIFVWCIDIGINPHLIALAALASIFGHAFSPFLRLKGGKAIATSFGAWSVLTKWEAPVLLGTVFAMLLLYKRKKTTPGEDTLIVLAGFLVLFFYVLLRASSGRTELLLLYFGNLGVILFRLIPSKLGS